MSVKGPSVLFGWKIVHELLSGRNIWKLNINEQFSERVEK